MRHLQCFYSYLKRYACICCHNGIFNKNFFRLSGMLSVYIDKAGLHGDTACKIDASYNHIGKYISCNMCRLVNLP